MAVSTSRRPTYGQLTIPGNTARTLGFVNSRKCIPKFLLDVLADFMIQFHALQHQYANRQLCGSPISFVEGSFVEERNMEPKKQLTKLKYFVH